MDRQTNLARIWVGRVRHFADGLDLALAHRRVELGGRLGRLGDRVALAKHDGLPVLVGCHCSVVLQWLNVEE